MNVVHWLLVAMLSLGGLMLVLMVGWSIADWWRDHRYRRRAHQGRDCVWQLGGKGQHARCVWCRKYLQPWRERARLRVFLWWHGEWRYRCR